MFIAQLSAFSHNLIIIALALRAHAIIAQNLARLLSGSLNDQSAFVFGLVQQFRLRCGRRLLCVLKLFAGQAQQLFKYIKIDRPQARKRYPGTLAHMVLQRVEGIIDIHLGQLLLCQPCSLCGVLAARHTFRGILHKGCQKGVLLHQAPDGFAVFLALSYAALLF